ncbi:MAG: FMN-binding protein [Pseudomonadota bacterium]
MKKLSIIFIIFFLNAFGISIVHGKKVYQLPEEFITQAFNGNAPQTSSLFLDDEINKNINDILGRDLNKIRVRYWANEQKSVWILEEIGKYEFITTGFVVEKSKISKMKVLIFRETRGWEVKYDFFSDQFKGIAHTKNFQLNKNITNISGATLSVNAVKKIASLALYLDSYIRENPDN